MNGAQLPQLIGLQKAGIQTKIFEAKDHKKERPH